MILVEMNLALQRELEAEKRRFWLAWLLAAVFLVWGSVGWWIAKHGCEVPPVAPPLTWVRG